MPIDAVTDVELVRRRAREAVASMVLLPGFQRARTTDGGLVAWLDVAGVRVFAGSPIGGSHVPQQRHVVFGRELDDDEPVPHDAYVVGEQPWWNAQQWSQTVARARSLRSQLHRARNKGVQCDVVDGATLTPGTALRARIEALLSQWLTTRSMAPMSFVATVDPLHLVAVRTVVVARQNDHVVGAAFAFALGPSRAVIDHIVRARDAPNGTSDALVDATMRALAARGVVDVTMGLCALSGRVPRVLQVLRSWTRGLYDFAGLYAFKARCAPDRWQRVLVEYPGQSAVRGTWHALQAFAGGSIVRFGWRTLVHRFRRWHLAR